jgi:hypothetical protein
MRFITPLTLLSFLLIANGLCANPNNQSFQVSRPGPHQDAQKLCGSTFSAQSLEDPFINIGSKISNSPAHNYFAILNGVPAIETKLPIAGTPDEILKHYTQEFRRCNYPFTILQLAENTYSFTGTVNNETKKILLTYDPEKHITLCVYTCETSNHELLQQRRLVLERFPELERLPGEVVYFKEYHQGSVISICAKVEFRGNAALAMNEISARFIQYGWNGTSTQFKSIQSFSKGGATAMLTAAEGRDTSMAIIVISDQG